VDGSDDGEQDVDQHEEDDHVGEQVERVVAHG
jgi:hypothetical protein